MRYSNMLAYLALLLVTGALGISLYSALLPLIGGLPGKVAMLLAGG
jgi:hypothetical protein